jgi:type IV pilus assembly protein PilA
MVVILIVGILAAIAIPRMTAMTAKAKVASAPQSIAAYERLQQTYITETGFVGTFSSISFIGANTNVFDFRDDFVDVNSNTGLSAILKVNADECKVGDIWATELTNRGVVDRTMSSISESCKAYTPSFLD